ncbi:MAG: cytosine deaminase, partial [Solibacillus sp.]
MDVSVLMIEELLNMSKNRVRKATERDVLNIKNEMLLLLNDKFNTSESAAIRTLINELHYLNVYVEK